MIHFPYIPSSNIPRPAHQLICFPITLVVVASEVKQFDDSVLYITMANIAKHTHTHIHMPSSSVEAEEHLFFQ